MQSFIYGGGKLVLPRPQQLTLLFSTGLVSGAPESGFPDVVVSFCFVFFKSNEPRGERLKGSKETVCLPSISFHLSISLWTAFTAKYLSSDSSPFLQEHLILKNRICYTLMLFSVFYCTQASDTCF